MLYPLLGRAVWFVGRRAIRRRFGARRFLPLPLLALTIVLPVGRALLRRVRASRSPELPSA